MRFMVMHKMTEEMERGAPPAPEIIQGVGKLIGEGAARKIFQGGEGLKPSSQRTHVVYKNGKRAKVTDGPFTEAKELVAGFALLKVKSKEEALAWADTFVGVLGGDQELFLGPVVEPWDLGMMPKPADPPLRFLSMHKMDAAAEADTPPDPKRMAKMGALIEEMTRAGVLESTGGLRSTSKGARIRFDGGKPKVTDGPFAESKELIAGYAILELPSKQEAIEWALRFGEVVKVNEVDVRQLLE
jgi:hypothetical protein